MHGRDAHATHGRDGHATKDGFTLVEIMVALVIIAIAAALVVPYASTKSSEAVSAAQTAAADIQYAQSMAITTQQPTTVTFATNGQYTLSNASGTLKQPMTGKAYVVYFGTTRGFEEVSVVSPSFGGTRSVTFDSTGAPDNAGSVTIQAGPHVYTLSVAAATGNVSVTRVGG
jgi:prepilin-type N-terminal cleavage/methylation domain-containing protein